MPEPCTRKRPVRPLGSAMLGLAVLVLVASGCQSTSNEEGNGAVKKSAPSGPVLIGVTYASDEEQSVKKNGSFQGAQNSKNIAQAIIDDINGRGGAGGRKLKLIAVNTPLAYTDTQQAQAEQAICSAFTRDAKAEIVLPVQLEEVSDNLLSCLKNTVTFSAIPFPQPIRRTYPNIYSTDVGIDRAQTALVAALVRNGAIKPGTKVGVVNATSNAFYGETAKDVTIPALEKAGATVVGTGTFDNRGLSNALRGLQGIVLKLKSKGAELIVPVDVGGSGLGVSATIAAQQRFLPRYAITSHAVPYGVLTETGPKIFRGGMSGISWQPLTYDLAPAQRPPATPASRRCQAIMRQAGLTSREPQVVQDQATVCDELFAVEAALQGSKGATDPASFATAMRTVRFAAATGAQLDFAEHKDGVAAYRDMSLDPSCGCMKLAAGKEQPLP